MKKMPGDTILLHVYHKWRSYNIWFLIYKVPQTEFFVIFEPFLPHYLPRKSKLWKNEKKKKTHLEISFYTCVTSQDVRFLRYGARRTEFFSFWTVFCPFIPLTQKIKIFKKWEKRLKISSFYTKVPKIRLICHTIPEMRRVTDVIFIFHFALVFSLYIRVLIVLDPLVKTLKNRFWKKEQ